MSKPDWARAAQLSPDELAVALEEDGDEVDDNPPLTDEELAALRPGAVRPGPRGPGKAAAKVPLTVRVESDVVAAWKATGAGWQGRIREVLRKAAPRRS